jgi:predicted negative regulator of RcsB-dependent stress response
VAEERTEEELIEALKIWWQENSFKVIAAIVLVVGGYFAWQSWQQNLTLESEEASSLWQSSIDIVATQRAGELLDSAKQQMVNGNADTLKADFSGTAYAHLAAALKAKLAVESGDLELAATELQWSLDNGPSMAAEILVRLRLARVEAARGNVELALQMLQGVNAGAHKSAYEEAKGDFYMLLSNAGAAYTAYDAAIVANKSSDQIVRNVLELKIGQVRPAQVPPQVLLNSDEASAATDMAGEGSQ